MKRGFTLVELLAILVILAIIATITVPLIINVLNETRIESRKRSIDLYGRAVENAAMNYNLLNKKTIEGKFTSSIDGHTLTHNTLGTTLEVDYNISKVVCDTIEIYDDQTVYLANCRVGGFDEEGTLVKNYTYGIKKNPKV